MLCANGAEKSSVGQLPKTVIVPEARAALHHARASVVASGTATVQALTIGNPFIVVYRVSSLTFALAKRLIRYPAEIGDEATLKDADGNLPIAMPNLIAGRRIVPELLNQRFTAANLAAALQPLLEDAPARRQMIADLAETRARLQPDPTSNPIHRVCDTALELLRSISLGLRRKSAFCVQSTASKAVVRFYQYHSSHTKHLKLAVQVHW